MSALSFEQAPPFSLPLRFFLTAPLFLLAAGALIAFAPAAALGSRWTPEALALTHLLTLGFLACVMLGALLQMLPVVAGAPLPRVRAVATTTHATLVAGTIALVAAFTLGFPSAYAVALAMLGLGLAVFVVAASVGLAGAAHSATVTGIRFALGGLALTLLLGFALGLARAGAWAPEAWAYLIEVHLAVGLLGWVLTLVAAVAWQVVPMFQLTPAYPAWLTRGLPGMLFAALGVRAASPVVPALAPIADAAIAGIVLAFAVATLDLQRRRRRRVPDVTSDFWRLGKASLIGCVGVWAAAWDLAGWSASDAYPVVLGVLFIGGFATSVVNGMLYKIVPFLAWFHLQTQLQAPAGSIPTMKTMIPERDQRWHFRVHTLACLALVLAPIYPDTAGRTGGIALALSALLLGRNLLAAVRHFTRHGGRF